MTFFYKSCFFFFGFRHPREKGTMGLVIRILFLAKLPRAIRIATPIKVFFSSLCLYLIILYYMQWVGTRQVLNCAFIKVYYFQLILLWYTVAVILIIFVGYAFGSRSKTFENIRATNAMNLAQIRIAFYISHNNTLRFY